MKNLKNNLFLILSVFFSLFAIISLFHPGFFPIHDDEQIARLFELNYALESFHFPPRISQNLGFGYGYPFFNFYPSLFYYFAEIFVILGFSFISSTKIAIAVGFILSAVFMYLFSRKYLGDLGGLRPTNSSCPGGGAPARGAAGEDPTQPCPFIFIPGL